jgi:TonB family protein
MIFTPMVIADAPSCNTPNHGVMVTKAAVPEYPDSARYLGIGPVTILVQVTVNADGTVANAQISKTSNNTALDQSALRSARQSTYSPMIVGCAPQSSDATLAITIAPNGADSMTVVPSEAAAACAIPNREAAIIEEVAPDLSGLESHVTGPTSVTVRVSVDPSGRAGSVTVVSSSGDRLLDDAVVRAARLSKYTPRYVDCKAVEGDYILLESLK